VLAHHSLGNSLHALLAEVPVDIGQALADMRDTRLVHSEEVSFFRRWVRPRSLHQGDQLSRTEHSSDAPLPVGSPVIRRASMGCPWKPCVARWPPVVDDPDGWAGTYPATQREHGTAMASFDRSL